MPEKDEVRALFYKRGVPAGRICVDGDLPSIFQVLRFSESQAGVPFNFRLSIEAGVEHVWRLKESTGCLMGTAFARRGRCHMRDVTQSSVCATAEMPMQCQVTTDLSFGLSAIPSISSSTLHQK